jgi:hypothetical protein
MSELHSEATKQREESIHDRPLLESFCGIEAPPGWNICISTDCIVFVKKIELTEELDEETSAIIDFIQMKSNFKCFTWEGCQKSKEFMLMAHVWPLPGHKFPFMLYHRQFVLTKAKSLLEEQVKGKGKEKEKEKAEEEKTPTKKYLLRYT